MSNRGLGAIGTLLDRLDKPTILRTFEDELKAVITYSEGYTPSTAFTPSSMICKRGMYYKALGTPCPPEEPDFQLCGMGESGSDRHNRLQDHIQKMMDWEWVDVGEYIKEKNLPLEVKMRVGNECKLRSEKYNVNFMLDGILKNKISGKYYILEIKTEISFKFGNREDVDPFHKHQGLAYSKLLDIPEVIFLYENRNDLSMKLYLYAPSEEEIQKYFNQKIGTVLEAIDKKEVPPKVTPFDITLLGEMQTYKVCQYCPYQKQCAKDGDF